MKSLPLIVAILILGALCQDLGCAPDNGTSRPNIILILADDLGWGDLGCYGATEIETPHCDRLAREGIRFTDAHSSSGVCSPSRYSVLTGRYAWRTWLKNGILMEHMPLLIETGRLTIAQMLHDRGYATACIGKWHLGWGNDLYPNWSEEVAPGPLEVGFDYFFGVPLSHQSSPEQRVFVRNRRVVGLEPGESIANYKTMRRVMRRMDLTATRLSEEAVGFIEANENRPFFLYYPTTNVHLPWTPDRRFLGSSQAGTYGDFVVEFDWVVGQILETLDRLDLSERTFIFLTSDNGANQLENMMLHKSNGPWRGIKGEIYEAGHRVPFIARWPGRIAPGSTCDETICLTDFMATIAAVVGYELPESSAEDSYDLTPALFGEALTGPIREATVHHSLTGLFAIRQGDWKLIDGYEGGMADAPGMWTALQMKARHKPVKNLETGEFNGVWYDFPKFEPDGESPPGQLYNLATDPGETDNVWDEHPEVVDRLLRLLDRYRRESRSRN
jgi:arylsulfatase A-like enzyme